MVVDRQPLRQDLLNVWLEHLSDWQPIEGHSSQNFEVLVRPGLIPEVPGVRRSRIQSTELLLRQVNVLQLYSRLYVTGDRVGAIVGMLLETLGSAQINNELDHVQTLKQ